MYVNNIKKEICSGRSSEGWVVKTTNKELTTYVGSVEKRGDDISENHPEENGQEKEGNQYAKGLENRYKCINVGL